MYYLLIYLSIYLFLKKEKNGEGLFLDSWEGIKFG